MKIFNKFVESKKEPSNKNDIWFDGSVVRLYEAGEWYTVTLSKEALEKLVKYAENVKIFKYVDTLPEIGDPSLIYFQKELSDGGIILVPYVYDDEWKQITNSEVFTETSPFGFGDAENSAVLKGGNNKVTNANEVALGNYNESNNDTRFSIGIGTSDTKRKNAVEVKQNGDVYITGIGGYNDDNFNKAKTLKSVIDNKIDKIEGKDLSSNDFTNALKEKLEGLENYDDAEISSAVEKLSKDFNALLGNNASAAIESFNEIIAFLEGIEDSASLDAIVASIQQEIAKVSNELADTDAKLTNLSERVEENEVLIEDLQNTKIDKEADDYYPQLSVGLADNLAGVDVVASEISFRSSGGGAISDGIARIEAIKGNSVVWNQLAVSQGMKGSYNNSEGEGISYQTTGLNVNYTTAINGHKIYARVIDRENKIPYFYFPDNVQLNLLGELFFTAKTTIEHFTQIIAQVPAGVNASWDIDCLFVDLTQMFGAGNEPTTIEEFNARKPLGIDENAYNEGEVIHMDAQSLESVGVNQWDEEWESGTIVGGNGDLVDDATKIRTSNLIRVLPNKEYHFTQPSQLPVRVFWYGADKAYKAYQAYEYFAESTSVLIPSDVYYIKVVFEYATYNHDICINLSDASINGKYFPYVKRTEDLSIIRKYFPEGMKSAGTAHDEIRYNKATQKWEKVQRIGSVDVGSLDLTYNSNNGGYFYVKLNGAKVPSSWKEVGNILAAQYNATYADSLVATGATPFNMSMGIAPNGNIYFVNTSYTDAASFKAAMAGVMLYYELAEPIVTEIEDDFNLDYEVWNGGTEEVISDVPTSPLKADIAYGFNAVGKIKELEEKINSGSGGVSKDYVDGKLTELSAEVSKKQDTITDLETIRSGAAKGATAIQEVKTINGQSIVGSGNIEIQGGGGGGASSDKQGVIRQTQTWTQAADKGYDYVMSNLVRGAIPQANIDLFTSAGAIFNEESGYFELNGLTDISYEEMSAIYNAGFKMVEGYWSNNIRTNIFRPCNVYNADAAQLYGFVGMYANRICKAESFKFTEQELYGVAIKSSMYGTYEDCIYLKTFGDGVFFGQDTNISDQAFKNCYSLETIYIRSLKKNIWFKESARLSIASVLYMVANSAATSAIVITLHADAYARAMADAEIVAALEAHPNVSLASA